MLSILRVSEKLSGAKPSWAEDELPVTDVASKSTEVGLSFSLQGSDIVSDIVDLHLRPLFLRVA
jgi:hypothetical protein